MNPNRVKGDGGNIFLRMWLINNLHPPYVIDELVAIFVKANDLNKK